MDTRRLANELASSIGILAALVRRPGWVRTGWVRITIREGGGVLEKVQADPAVKTASYEIGSGQIIAWIGEQESVFDEAVKRLRQIEDVITVDPVTHPVGVLNWSS